MVPTFEARLMLHDMEFKRNKKSVDLPFSTREREGRELKDYYTLDVSVVSGSERYTNSLGSPSKKSPLLSTIEGGKKNELTSHSGKFSNDLMLDVEVRNKLLGSKNKKGHKRGSSETN